MKTALAAFATHCQRAPLDRRPTVWVQFRDIWKTPKGEIGIPDPVDISHTCFALLSPWAMIPTLGQAWLIVDRLDYLSVTNLKVNMRGMFEPHWSVPYKMADDGSLSFGKPALAVVAPEIGHAVIAAKRARRLQTFWDMDHQLETVLPIVEGLLNQ